MNKLSTSNYEKLKNEFLCYYNTLLTNEIDLGEINEFIFTMLTRNNEIFNELYSSIFSNLININNDFSNILNNNIKQILNIYEKLNYESISNKSNDECRCFILFYINCIKKDILPVDIIFELLDNIFDKLFEFFKIENNKIKCEVLTDIIFYIIKNSYNLIHNSDNYKKFYYKVNNIKSINNIDYPSFRFKFR